MVINIENCKSIEEYLILCNVKSINDLTKEQVLAWAKSGKMGLVTQFSIDIVENGMFGVMPNMDKAIKLLKQAMLEKKDFYCSYVESESCNGPLEEDDAICDSFEMFIR